MAAPTDVRVEALSITSTIIRWVYAGSASMAVFRSTDGISYAEITDDEGQARVVAGTEEFTDTGLATATKYWYKLSDDGGSTFSSVVTVFTHTCAAPARENIDTTLPRAEGEVTPQDFNDLAVRVETGWTRFIDPDGRTCVACISGGAVVIDCISYDMCDVIEVEVTEDINSVSMPNCENAAKEINFLIPPNTTRKICGFPGGSGFSGDECFRAPIRGGANGRTVSVPTRRAPLKSRPGVVRGLTGGTGATCTCVPTADGGLTIKSCTPNNSLSCSGGKSLTLKACGGRPPYSWSKTGDVTLQVGAGGTPGSTAEGSTVIVKPPTNSGSAVAGIAYTLTGYSCSVCVGGGTCFGTGQVIDTKNLKYGCDDVVDICQDAALSGSCTPAPAISAQFCGSPNPQCAVCTYTACNDPAMGNLIVVGPCDNRTAPMIAAGCAPCGLQAGSTVSVTDSMGTVTTIILRN